MNEQECATPLDQTFLYLKYILKISNKVATVKDWSQTKNETVLFLWVEIKSLLTFVGAGQELSLTKQLLIGN